MMDVIEWTIPGICGMGLNFRLDGFRLIYVCIAILMWGMSGLFSKEYMAHYENKGRYYTFFWVTFVATIAVFLSADLYTTFIFFEIMSFTSYVWVAFDEKKESLKAAETYLAVAIIGGMVMLMGLFLLYDLLGTLKMEELGAAAVQVLAGGAPANGALVERWCEPHTQLYLAGGLLLFGFGAKAGCFPLHIWLPKAHPVAPAPTSALLSGILTKTGIFGILVVTCNLFAADGNWGFLITALGLITMFLGALLALFSVNLKRTLACSSVSQIGFILTGIGMSCLLMAMDGNNAIAVRGTFLHMVNHSLIKLVLFLCAGVVFMNLHQLNLNDIRGFGRKKPALCFSFLMGALGIGGIPLWNGYVSKTLLHEGIVEYRALLAEGVEALGMLANPQLWAVAEWLFLLTGGMTVAYMLKLFVVLFVEKHPVRQMEFDEISGAYMNQASRFALIVSAAILPILGMLPGITMDKLADMGQSFFMGDALEHTVHYLSWGNLKGSFISIGIGIFLYVVVVRGWMMKEGYYVDRWPVWLDLENLVYRPVLQVALPGIVGAVFEFIDRYLVSTVVTVFLTVSAVVCRGMDHLADSLILLARKTTHRQVCGEREYHFVKLGRVKERLKRSGGLVEESFSFGLLLFCIGLCLTLWYLLAVAVL